MSNNDQQQQSSNLLKEPILALIKLDEISPNLNPYTSIIKPLDAEETQTATNNSADTILSNNDKHVPKLRTRTSSSIKQFTEKALHGVQRFSNDMLRSIENAHEMVDLKNSNFSSATQSVAAQFYTANYLTPNYHRPSLLKTGGSGLTGSRNVTSENLDELETSSGSHSDHGTAMGSASPKEPINRKIECLIQEEDRAIKEEEAQESPETIQLAIVENSTTMATNNNNSVNKLAEGVEAICSDANESAVIETERSQEKSIKPRSGSQFIRGRMKSFREPFSKAIDQANAINSEFSQPASMSAPKPLPAHYEAERDHKPLVKQAIQAPSGKDHTDFTTKRRHILYNGLKKAIPDEIHISIFEVFIYLWGVITFFADLISDVILSIEYFNSNRMWLGTLTLVFVIVPNITLSLFSLSWYIDKYYTEKQANIRKNLSNPAASSSATSKFSATCDSITFWTTTLLFVTFQLDLIWKYIQGLVYTVKGWACRSLFKNLKWEKYYIEKQIKCDTDIGMLRLIDVYLDSGPQVLLQLYVITTQNLNDLGSANLVVFTFKDFQTTSVELKQLISILSSLFSMGYALAGYHRCLRNQQFIFCLETNKPLPKPMSWPSTIMQFLWYLLLIAPRVLSMALFASIFRSWFFMIIFTHWLIMYFWILRLKTNYCITSPDVYSAREEIFEKFYDFVCSFIYIFVYFNLKAGPTRLRYLIYYILFYAENVLFSACYFMFSQDTNFAYKLTMLLVVIFGFWAAIGCQLVYYLYLHPSQDFKICVRRKSIFHFIHKETLKPANFSVLNTTAAANALNSSELRELRHLSKKRTVVDSSPPNNIALSQKNSLSLSLIKENQREKNILNEDEVDDKSSFNSSVLAEVFDASARRSVKSIGLRIKEENESIWPIKSGTLLDTNKKEDLSAVKLDESESKRQQRPSDELLTKITAPDNSSYFSSIKSFLTFSSLSTENNEDAVSRFGSSVSLSKRPLSLAVDEF